MSTAEQTQAIREFFLHGDMMERFVNNMQSGPRCWSSVLDHAGRLVVAGYDRECLWSIQPHGDGQYAAVEYQDTFQALDPDVQPEPDSHEVRLLGVHPTPEAAFEGLVRHLDLAEDMGLDEAPAP